MKQKEFNAQGSSFGLLVGFVSWVTMLCINAIKIELLNVEFFKYNS
jgi:hypothetical protein